VGVLGGIVALRDATPPPRVSQKRRPRLALRLRYGRLHRCSRRRAASVRVTGPDRALVKSVVFRYHRKRARDRRAPFAARFRVGPARLGRRVSARVTLRGGKQVRLTRAVQPCAQLR